MRDSKTKRVSAKYLFQAISDSRRVVIFPYPTLKMSGDMHYVIFKEIARNTDHRKSLEVYLTPKEFIEAGKIEIDADNYHPCKVEEIQ